MARTTYDPEKFNLDIVRLKKGGEIFEIVVNPDEALAFRKDPTRDIKDVLKYEKIFSNCQRGLASPEFSYEKVFGTKDVLSIAKIILLDGEVRLTAEFKRAELERKKAQIIGLLQRNCMDPRTQAPHTPARIEMGMQEAKVKIDEFKSAESQLQGIVTQLQKVLPLSFEIKKIQVTLSSLYSETGFNYLKGHYKVVSHNWAPDRSWTGVVEVPAGLEEDFMGALNKMSHGSVHIDILR